MSLKVFDSNALICIAFIKLLITWYKYPIISLTFSTLILVIISSFFNEKEEIITRMKLLNDKDIMGYYIEEENI